MFIASILNIVITFTYIFALDLIVKFTASLSAPSTTLSFSIWSALTPGFGIFGPIFVSIIGIIGIVINKITSQKKEVQDSKIKNQKSNQTQDVMEEEDRILRNFCPECGVKLGVKDMRFCTSCGTSLDEI